MELTNLHLTKLHLRIHKSPMQREMLLKIKNTALAWY